MFANLKLDLEAFFAIFIFAFVPVAIKATSANPFTIGLFRLSLATLGTAIWWRKKLHYKMFVRRDAWKLLILGIFFFCHWITYFYSIKTAGPSICVLGMSTYGLQLILWGSLFLGHKINKKHIFALALILSGVFFIVPEFSLNNQTTLGLCFALASASFYAFLPIFHQKFVHLPQEERIFSQFFFCGLLFSLFLPLTEWNLTVKDYALLIFLAVFGTLIAHALWAKVTSRLPTTTTGLIYYIITPSAMFLSFILLNDRPGPSQLLGGALVLSGSLLNLVIRKPL